MCDFLYWLDDEWPEQMQRALQRMWVRLEAKFEEEHSKIWVLFNEEKRKRKEAEGKKNISIRKSKWQLLHLLEEF